MRKPVTLAFVAVGLTAAGQAFALAGPGDTVNFAIRASSTSDALIALAVQSGLSIGGGGSCHGRETRLAGRYTVAQALDRLLAGSGCRFDFVDPRTVKISVGAPLARLPPKPAPEAPEAAAPPPPPSPTRLGELMVSPTKRPGFVGASAGASDIISGGQIDDTGLTDTEGVARQSASFATTNLGPARNKILLRGLSDGAFTGRTQSTVGTYLDDAPVTYNAPDPDLRLTDVDEVEILRGPQGALYGSGSLSGIYRIVTRKPRFDETTASLEASAGTTQGGAPSTSIDAVFNAPIAPGEAAARVVVYDERQGGYLQDESLRLSNVDLTERTGARAALRWLMGNHWRATFTTAAQTLDSADTQYVTPGGSVMRGRSNQVRESHHNDFGQAALTITGDGDWGSLESATAVVNHRYNSRYDASAVLTAFGADPADEVGLFDEASATRLLVQDVYWSSPERGRLHFIAGLYGSTMLEHSPSSLLSRAPNGALARLYQEQRRDLVREGAAYGEGTVDLGQGWTLAAGGRLFETRVHTVSQVTVLRPNQLRNLDRAGHYGGFSPKISLQKRWDGGSYVYLLGSAGYRAGGFNTGGLLAPTAATAAFRPDRLQNVELGGQLMGWGGRLSLRSAVFYDHWDDIQTDQYLGSGISYTANVGDGRNTGWETELGFQLTERLKVQANALVDHPEVTSLNPTFTGIIGARLPGVPDTAFSGLLSYRRSVREHLDFLTTVAAAYTGDSRLTFDSRFSPVTPNYYTAQLSAQLVWPKTRIAAFVSNPFNTSKDTFAYGNPFSFGQVRQVTPQRPRTISLMVSRNL